MSDTPERPAESQRPFAMLHQPASDIQNGQGPDSPTADAPRIAGFLQDLLAEIDGSIEPATPNPHMNIALHLLRSHFEGRIVSPSSVVAASGVPYATGVRKLAEMTAAGLIEQRARTKTGKSFSLHPSADLLRSFDQFAGRVDRLVKTSFAQTGSGRSADYYFGGSYQQGQTLIPPPTALPKSLNLSGGLRILVHGDPTFMVMENLKRQFEQIVGAPIRQRAFSIDRLREEALRDAARPKSRYDLIAVDLPWIGEFVANGVIRPLPDVMDISRLDPGDFHTAGWPRVTSARLPRHRTSAIITSAEAIPPPSPFRPFACAPTR